MTTILTPPLTAGVTTTTGSGNFVISAPLPVPGGGVANYRLFSGLPNGSTVHVLRSDAGGVNYESELCTVSITSGVATLMPVTRIDTSAGGATPVTWAGTQNVWSINGSFQPANGGLEFQPYAAAYRTSLGLDSAAVLPAYKFGYIPTGGGTDGAWTGGGTGKVVRLSSSNTFTNASNTDTEVQLTLISYLNGSAYFTGAGLITGLSGLTTGAVYFLGTAGAMLSWTGGALPVTVTPGGTTKLIRLGVAPSTTSLFWQPQFIAKG